MAQKRNSGSRTVNRRNQSLAGKPMANQPMSIPSPKPKPKPVARAATKPVTKESRRKLGPPQAVSNTLKPHRVNPKGSSTDRFLAVVDEVGKISQAPKPHTSGAARLKKVKGASSKAKSLIRKMSSGPTAESRPFDRKITTGMRTIATKSSRDFKRFAVDRPLTTTPTKDTKKRKK